MVCWLALLLAPVAAVAADPTDRIGVPGPIRFGDTEFALQWVSNPSPELYKQEYVPAGQRVERYDSMLLIDVRPAGADLAQTARAMIEQIEARKARDPVANVEVLVNEAGDERCSISCCRHRMRQASSSNGMPIAIAADRAGRARPWWASAVAAMGMRRAGSWST